MSGGTFDYIQSRIEYDVIEKIKSIISLNRVELTEKELRDTFMREYDREYFEKYPEAKLHSNFSDETMAKFVDAVDVISKAYIYIQRIDYLLAGDDGEDSFHIRLNEELNSYERNI
jgi:hypothetical protein